MQKKAMNNFAIIAAIAKPKIAGKHPRAPPELDTTELGTTELGTTELGTTELGTTELGTTELGTTELGTTELGTTGSEDKRTNNKTKFEKSNFFVFTSSLIVIFKVAFLITQNRPLPNYFWLLFQSEPWCSSFHMKISFIHMQRKTNFHIKE